MPKQKPIPRHAARRAGPRGTRDARRRVARLAVAAGGFVLLVLCSASQAYAAANHEPGSGRTSSVPGLLQVVTSGVVANRAGAAGNSGNSPAATLATAAPFTTATGPRAHKPVSPAADIASTISGMPPWLEDMLFAVGVLIAASFAAEPFAVLVQHRRLRLRARGTYPAHRKLAKAIDCAAARRRPGHHRRAPGRTGFTEPQ